MRDGRRFARWIVRLALACVSVANAAPPMHIEFAEKVGLPPVAGKAQFDAYGRRFALTLEANDRLLRSLPVTRKAALGGAQVLRGKVDGVAGSWVRLTRVAGGLEGAIWDGNELYVVARYGSIAAHLTIPLQATADQTVVYRLSDTLNGLPPEFCGLIGSPALESSAAASSLQQYKAVVGELRANAAAGTLTDSINVSLIADKAFQDANGANTQDVMLARLNVVDGIFSEQVGVLIAPAEFRLMPAGSDPFTSTNPGVLLGQLATYREATPAVRAAGLAHLMTGKDMDGDVVGIAFVDALCDAREGVSVGDSTAGTFLSALVMAHELGHNFGARHDGVAGVCAGTPPDFLMATVLNGSAQFSQCSLNSMASQIALARGVCIGTPDYADVGLVLPQSPFSAQTNGTFSLPVTVRSYGTLASSNVRLVVTFPVYFNMVSATVAGANCTVAGNQINCALGNFAAGSEQALDLRITGGNAGSFPVTAALTADADRVEKNNTGTVQVGLQSGVDLGVSITPSSNAVFVTDPVDYTVDVVSHGALASHGGTLQINIGGIPIESFNGGPHTCAVQAGTNWILLCQLADVAAGASTRITLRGRPDQPRTATGGVYLNVPNDYDATNNEVIAASVVVSAEREVRTTVSTEELRAVIGTSYELTYTLTTLGRLPALNVRFSLQQPPMGVVESVNAGGATCLTDPDFTHCEIGTLNPGDVRTVVVRFHMTAAFPSFMFGSTRWSGGAVNQFSSVHTGVYANSTIDVAAGLGNNFGVDEDVVGEAGFNVETKGVDPGQNVTATLELPAPMKLLTLTYSDGPTGWTCTLLTPQSGRCTGSFTGGSLFNQRFAVAKYTFSSSTAGEYDAKLTVNAPNDGNADNNVAHMPLVVRPYVDVSLAGPNATRLLVTGQITTVDATLHTGKNPVPGATLVPWASDASLALDSLTVTGFDCSQTQSGNACALGTLPANASINVRAVFRAVGAGMSPYAVLNVYPDRDSNSTNNHVSVPINTVGMSDVSVSVAQASVIGTNGAALLFPRITVSNGAELSRDVSVDIPLPPFVTVASMSVESGLCTGTTTLQCVFSGIAPNNTRSIDISLNATATGTFTSNLLVHAVNDSTANNNSTAVAFTVNAAPTGGGSSSGGGTSSGGGSSSSSGGGASAGGGGGGGGSFDWLALSLLGGLLLRKWGHSPFAGKRGRT